MLSFAGNDYKKTTYCTVHGKSYWIISPTGDGNCGLYAFACSLIDAITSHKLIFDPELFNNFKSILLQNLASCDLKEFLEDPSVSFEQFRDFLLQNYSNRVKKLTHLLSNSLRQIGYDHFFELLKTEAEVNHLLDVNDQHLKQDKTFIGFEILVSLANYFKINLGLIGYNSTTQSYYWAHAPNKSQAFFLLFNAESHWHYLLPKKQAGGLSEFLPALSIGFQERMHNALKKLVIKLVSKLYKLPLMMQTFKRIFTADKVISIDTNQKKITHLHQNLAVDNLIQFDAPILEIIDNLSHLDPNKFNLILNTLRLKEIEKTLITQAYVIDNKTDEIAINLQNLAVFDFFKANYSFMVKKKSGNFTLFFKNTFNHASQEKIFPPATSCSR